MFLSQLEHERSVCTWSPFVNEANMGPFRKGWYIAPNKPIKPTQMILKNAQQRIFFNGAIQR